MASVGRPEPTVHRLTKTWLLCRHQPDRRARDKTNTVRRLRQTARLIPDGGRPDDPCGPDACKGDIDSAVAPTSDAALALASTAARTAPPSPPSPPRAPEPEPAATIETARSPDDWVGAFVAEMARSSDIPDARAAAARALRAFESFVSARSARQADQRADRLERENLVLKRAVAVQARRLEATDGEKAALERTVSAQAERLRRAERTNYALSVHLHRASPGGMPDNRPPDVY